MDDTSSTNGQGDTNGLPTVASEGEISLPDEAELDDARNRMIEWAERQLQAMPETLDMDEAKTAFRSLLARSQLHEDGKWISRFLLGELARRVRAQTDHGNITERLEEIAERYGININTLRYAIGVAKSFDANLRLFDKWLRSGGYQKRWKDIKAVVREGLDPKEYGAEALADEVVKIVEGATQELDEINQDIQEQKANEQDLDGATTAFSREVARFRDESLGALEDAEREEGERRSHALEMLIRMVRQMDCCACGKPANPDKDEVESDPHHVASSIHGDKQNDWARIPLCRECHGELEDGSLMDFQRKHGVSITAELAKIQHYWITGERLDLPGVIASFQWNPF